MPKSPARLCNGCGQIVRGRCPDCAKPWATSTRRGSTWASRKLRAQVLAEQPICAWPGCNAPSTQDDHIVPLHLGGSDDRANHQGLCNSHHTEKTLLEARAAKGRGV